MNHGICCRSEASVSESADELAPAQAAGPASIGSLIQKFERANQADAQVCPYAMLARNLSLLALHQRVVSSIF